MVAWKSLDVRLLTMHHGRDTGDPEGPSESEPVREARPRARQAVEAERVHSGRDPSPLRHERGALAASGVASSQPTRPCLASAWSSCRPMFRVKEVVSEASKVLRSSSLHPLMMSEAVARRSIVIVTSDGVACSS